MVQEIKFVFLSFPVLFHAAYFHLEQIFFFWEEEKKKKPNLEESWLLSLYSSSWIGADAAKL